MNPLQQQPHLFANGKFKIVSKSYKKSDNQYFKYKFTPDLIVNLNIDNFLLVARKIEDITDREFEDVFKYDASDREKYNIRSADTFVDEFLHLISIGVYPFDQSHFDDGTVIDTTNI